jgi:hypothetical protein
MFRPVSPERRKTVTLPTRMPKAGRCRADLHYLCGRCGRRRGATARWVFAAASRPVKRLAPPSPVLGAAPGRDRGAATCHKPAAPKQTQALRSRSRAPRQSKPRPVRDLARRDSIFHFNRLAPRRGIIAAPAPARGTRPPRLPPPPPSIAAGVNSAPRPTPFRVRDGIKKFQTLPHSGNETIDRARLASERPIASAASSPRAGGKPAGLRP